MTKSKSKSNNKRSAAVTITPVKGKGKKKIKVSLCPEGRVSPRHGDTSSIHLNAAAASSPSSPAQINESCSHCIKCKLVVSNTELAMECDICHHFTHVDCDDNMYEDIYDILAKHPNNSLLYLCSSCEPKLKSTTQQQRYIDQAVKQLEKVTNDSHSSLEFQMDMLVKSVSGQVGNLRSTVDDLNTHLSSFENRMLSKPPNPRPIQEPDSHQDKTTDSVGAHPTSQTQSTQKSNYLTTNSFPDFRYPPPRGPNTQSPYITPSFPNLTNNKPETPPNIRHAKLVLGHPAQAGQKTYVPPPYRGPPLYNLTPKKPKPPDPSKSLVVYNIPSTMHPFDAATRLAADCAVYSWQILSVQHLPTSRSNPPIAITCKDIATKWHMIKEINKIESIYAKPFLDEEDRKADQELVRSLRSIKQKHVDKTFKIHRGEIYQIIDDHLVKYNSARTRTTPTEATTQSNTQTVANNPLPPDDESKITNTNDLESNQQARSPF